MVPLKFADYPESFGRRRPLGRLVIAGAIALVSLISYFAKRSFNPVTNKVQHVDMSVRQEVGIGLQAAPEMSAQYGGLSHDPQGRALVDRVGKKIISIPDISKTQYPFEFH